MRVGSITVAWGRYREEVVVASRVGLEAQRVAFNSFWTGASVVMSMLMEARELTDEQGAELVRRLLEEVQGYRNGVMVNALMDLGGVS